jgi:predicted transposase YdaD
MRRRSYLAPEGLCYPDGDIFRVSRPGASRDVEAGAVEARHDDLRESSLARKSPLQGPISRSTMADELHKPRDSLFQWTFSNVDHARAELAAILPEGLLRHLDLSTLELCSAGTADKRLGRFEIDLLYSVRLCGAEALLYLAFEHLSTVDRLMPLRMLDRIHRVLQWYVERRGRSADCLPLPVVIPVVIHHSNAGWTAALRFESLFDPALLAEPDIAALVPHFGFVLDDISHVSDEALGRRALGLAATLSLWALRDGRRSLERLLQSFRHWARAMSALAEDGPHGQDALKRVLGYLMGVNDALTLEELNVLFEALPAKEKKTMMTLAEQLEARGEARGEAEGEARGEARGERKLLVRQLAHKFGELPDAARRRIEEADETQLISWAEKVLSAETLSDVLGDGHAGSVAYDPACGPPSC